MKPPPPGGRKVPLGDQRLTRNQLSNEELDAVVVRSLSRLPTYGPSRFFAGKVMSRVALPAPRAVLAWRRSRAWLAQPRRALTLAGAYALSATIALIIAVPWLVQHSPVFGMAYDWTVARGGALLREAALAVAGWTLSSGIADAVRSVPLTATTAWVLAFAATLAYAAGAIGLHFLLRAPREKQHAPVRIPS